MKRLGLWLVSGITVLVLGVSTALAAQVGTVDMQQIFQNSSQVKKINDSLSKQFSSRRESIIKMGKTFQDDLQKFQKDKTVMSAKDANALKDKLTKEENDLRQAQAKFQQDLFAAQNDQMSKFMQQVKDVVKGVAADKKLDLVLPKNSVLYAPDGTDITSDVVSKLK